METPADLMSHLLTLAHAAAQAGEVPVAAAVVDAATGDLVSEAVNRVERDSDPTAHAEILALRQAAEKIGSPRLPMCDLYVTLEPCTMCAAAISFTRVRKLVFGAYDPKGGGVEHGASFFRQRTCHHAPEVIGGIREEACAELLQQFFREKR